jgi:hypothetical protein
MTKPDPKTIEHREEGPTSLPSMHIDHSSVLLNELDTRLMGFDSGIVAVVADMDGMQQQFEREQAERAATHATEIEKRHRLKRDLERGRAMVLAAKAAYSNPMSADVDEPDAQV